MGDIQVTEAWVAESSFCLWKWRCARFSLFLQIDILCFFFLSPPFYPFFLRCDQCFCAPGNLAGAGVGGGKKVTVHGSGTKAFLFFPLYPSGCLAVSVTPLTCDTSTHEVVSRISPLVSVGLLSSWGSAERWPLGAVFGGSRTRVLHPEPDSGSWVWGEGWGESSRPSPPPSGRTPWGGHTPQITLLCGSHHAGHDDPLI